METIPHRLRSPGAARSRIAATLALTFAAAAVGCAGPEPRAPSAEAPGGEPAVPFGEIVTERIRERIEATAEPAARAVADDVLRAPEAVPGFYASRGYAPAWSREGRVSAEVESLLAVVAESGTHGLTPADYHADAVRTLLDAVREMPDDVRAGSRLADLDCLLTDSFLLLASDLRTGHVNPETIDPEWNTERPGNEPVAVLTAALRSRSVATSLRELAPQSEGYERLRAALARYREESAAPWTLLGPGETLRPGARGPRVAPLRERLREAGVRTDSDEVADPELFDANLARAVRAFQSRHGLAADGVVGAATYAELDIPPSMRVPQIEANLERWRWLPRDFGSRYILVNIAAFELDVVESGRSVLGMRIVAGRNYRRTPVFSGRMTYLVFCPYWNVPPLLAEEDELPAMRKDPAALVAQGMRVLEGWGADEREIDPMTVDWSKVTPKNLLWHFRQDPGPMNALGGVKFMLPNKFDVYLHDTPATALFAKMPRDFSSGCIRVEKPLDLAEYVLSGDRKWDREKIEAAIKSGEERTVNLRNPIPVHLLYWTAWVDPDGTLQFRKDVYGRDARLLDALHRELPPS